MRGRVRAYVALAAVAVAVLAPPLVPPAADSYPLSTYPMFSRDRGARSEVATLVGVDTDGEEHRLSPTLIGGTDEPMQAVATAGRAARGTPAERARLCAQVAERVARSDRHEVVEVVEVVLQVEEHDPVATLTGGDLDPLTTRVLARCAVPR